MALLTPTSIGPKHVLGDLVSRSYILPAVVNSGDTLVVLQGAVSSAIIVPTTATTVGATFAANTPMADQTTITFVSSGAWTGRVAVQSRIG